MLFQFKPRANHVIVKKNNKLTSTFYASVLLLMINCAIILSKWLWNRELQASGPEEDRRIKNSRQFV